MTSGVIEGLVQGEANLAEEGPLANTQNKSLKK